MSLLGTTGEVLGSMEETLTALVITKEVLDENGNPAQSSEPSLSNCANCGATLAGNYCHSCGQSSHIHRSLLHMMEEFLHGLFHFDTKAWRTIPALIFKPGKLTKDYIEGKRTSFVSPLALFLFLNFLMFFVFSLTVSDNSKGVFEAPQTREELVKELEQTQAIMAEQKTREKEIRAKKESTFEIRDDMHSSLQDIRTIQDKIDALDGKEKTKSELEAEMAKLQLALLKLQQSQQKSAAINDTSIGNKSDVKNRLSEDEKLAIDHIESDMKYFKKKLAKLENIKLKAGKITKDAAQKKQDESLLKLKNETNNFNEIPYIGKYIARANKNPELVLYKAKKNASSLAFLLVPLSLPFLWILFVFKRRYVMFYHAVFSLYSLSFMFILLMIVAVLGKFHFGGTATMLIAFVPPLHMYVQLKEAYDLKIFGTLWRTCALLLIALTSLLLYLLIVVGAASA